MSTNEDPIDPKDLADIPSRVYSRPGAADKLRMSGNLVLETAPNTSWAFPLAHLIRYDWNLRTIESPWAISETAPKIRKGTIRLQFPTATVTVETSAPEEIVKSILLRHTLVLTRGGAYSPQRPGEREHCEYVNSIPSDERANCHCEATGIIKVNNE